MGEELLDLKIVRIGRVYENVSAAMVRQWISERRVTADDLVRPVGAERWMKVSLAPELYQARGATPQTRPVATPVSAALPAARQPAGRAPTASIPTNVSLDTADLGIREPAISRPRKKRAPMEDTELDMTPMIDVVFQLLIFFMFANQLANPSPIEVPVAKYGKGVTPDGKQSILVDDQGRYYLGDVAKEEFVAPSLDVLVGEVATNAANAEQPLEVIINAHKSARHLSMRELLERLGQVQNIGPIHVGVEEKR